jgi:transposase
MLDEPGALPEDPEELRAFTARLLAELKAQAVLIEKLRHQLAGHRAHRFGSSSETADQLQLALETSEIAAAAMTATLRLPDIESKGKPKRRPIPDHIPRTEVEITPAEDHCAGCGGALRRIGEDVTEELEYVPGRFIVNRIVRPRFACSGCESFTQAPLPSRPIERGRSGPGLLAHALVSKYADHLPLYRQSQIFEREGIDLDRSTLADWVGKSPLYWSRWPTRSGSMCWPVTPSSPTIPPSGCWRREQARRRTRASGPMSAMSAHGAATCRRRPGTASQATARGGTRRTTSPASGAVNRAGFPGGWFV